ncbi:MAG TPA: hypothetical protein DEA44_11450 [Firmicutes bacterium]|nr:hypothetical protein [Bacillota bacterium]
MAKSGQISKAWLIFKNLQKFVEY